MDIKKGLRYLRSLNANRDMYKSFRACKLYADSSVYKTKSEFLLEGNYIRIKNVALPLINIFKKFQHVKYIEGFPTSKTYTSKILRDIGVIRKSLPRNRSITLNVVD